MLQRDLDQEVNERVAFIRKQVEQAKAKGVVYGNSGGKDSALVGILCKLACPDTLGVCMPCASSQNYGRDLRDARLVAQKFQIETITVDLSAGRTALKTAVEAAHPVSESAAMNLAPRLRMTALYAIAQSRQSLVAGTGNRSEGYVGYFTKWGDGACDFNPIADLTVTEVYKLLRWLKAPEPVINKAPSAGLFEGQTDEEELGVSYAALDAALLKGGPMPETVKKLHAASEHKRRLPLLYPGAEEEK